MAVKFGRSTSLESRFSALKAENAVPLELYGFVQFHAWLEDAIHLELQEFRMHGEWFKIHPRVEQIANLIREKDLPALYRLASRLDDDFDVGI